MRTRTRREITAWLEAHFFLRLHMFLILGGTCAAGAVATKILYELGVDFLALRYAIAVCAAYLFFLALIRIWLWYVHRGGIEVGPEMADGAVETALYAAPDAPSGCLPEAGGCDEGCAVGVALVLLAGVAFAGIYFIWAAPAILSEAAFEFLLAAALARSARRIDRPGWVGRVWRTTFWPFVGVLLFAVLLGFLAQDACPDARRLTDAWECWQSR